MADAAITAVITTNLVAGSAPSPVGSPSFSFVATNTTSPVNNPHVTVSLVQPNLPTFFARIFGRTGASVTASATAEAYNPANLASYIPDLAEVCKALAGRQFRPCPIWAQPFVDKRPGRSMPSSFF